MSRVYGVYGASGFGREVLPLVRASIDTDAKIYFIDDSQSGTINGHEIISFDMFVALQTEEKSVVIAIANSKVRELLTQKCMENKLEVITVKAQNSVELDSVELGEGSVLCPFVTLTSNIKIGKSFHANIYSYVAHDCVIGDYVTFAPAVKCNGNVHIEDHAYIGTGAIIHQGKENRPLKIGKGAVISAGAVVTKSVPAGKTVFGNPAIELTKENMKRRM